LGRWRTRAAVDAEVAGLPERLRAVVVLCLLEGQSNVEAAKVLGLARQTIMVLPTAL
jgi:DNA-directed RNA polymerase specialized sigma24 family protein